MKKTNQKSVIYPDFVSSSVLKIDTKVLKSRGISHIVFDIDETIVPRQHNELSKEYITFLQSLEKQGFKLLIGSNTRRDISNITRHLDTVIVKPTRFSFKPFGHYFRKVVAATGVAPSQIVMVGDKMLNDVIGGNLAGLTTILVEPYAQQQSLFHRYYLKMAMRKS